MIAAVAGQLESISDIIGKMRRPSTKPIRAAMLNKNNRIHSAYGWQ